MADEVRIVEEGGFPHILKAYSLNPLSAFLIGLAALFRNPNLLKSFSAFLFYGAVLMIPTLEWIHRRVSRLSFLCAFVYSLILVNFAGLIFGVRQGPASALAVLGAYLWLRDRRAHMGGAVLILSVLLHFSSIVVLFAVVVSNIRGKIASFILYVLIAFYTIISYIGAAFLSALGILPATQLLIKMNGYYAFGSNFELFASVTSQMVAVLRLCVCIGLLVLMRYYTRGRRTSMQPYCRFFYVMVLLCVGSLLTSTPFRRFTGIALYAAIPMVAWFFECFLTPRYAAMRMFDEVESIPVKEKKAYSYEYHMFLYVGIVCIVSVMMISLVYDWHSLVRFYVSARQTYGI